MLDKKDGYPLKPSYVPVWREPAGLGFLCNGLWPGSLAQSWTS